MISLTVEDYQQEKSGRGRKRKATNERIEFNINTKEKIDDSNKTR
jgi:hypothetical protein